ncbi:MAG: hypothetical protein QT10_C0007G0045 [archaeon GW2011_AR19]|nr:MAG: hypothetical protein QT10_C0007G0045 [archaeon GW2011_AR19]
MNQKNLLKVIIGGLIICGGYFGAFNYSSYSQENNFLKNLKEEYKNEIAKDRMEIYKNLPFVSKVSSFGAYLAAKEIYNQTNKNKK